MPGDWFDAHAEVIGKRIDRLKPNRIQFVAGVRVNGKPHIGTYLTLASAFIFATRCADRFRLTSIVRVQFLDNDPAIYTDSGSHFHCIYQTRTAADGKALIHSNYGTFLHELSGETGQPCNSTAYSADQSDPDFRATVLRSLAEWNQIKYYLSGTPLMDRPPGVRGLGCPCPVCGLYNGQVRPRIDWNGADETVLTTECCIHGEFSEPITPRNSVFLNLDTTFRNVIKEIIAAENKDSLSIMIKGVDWKNGLTSVDLGLRILGVPEEIAPLRVLLPVIQTEAGVRLSKSGIARSPELFRDLPPHFLDATLLPKAAEQILTLANGILNSETGSGLVPISYIRQWI